MATGAEMEEELYRALAKCPLFADIPQEKYPAVLSCLKGEERSFVKDQVLLFAGETSKRAGVLLSGEARVLMYCADGRCVSIGNLSEGEVFGEALACSPTSGSPLQVEAVSPVRALYLDFDPLLAESSGCQYRSRVTRNLLLEMSRESQQLNGKIRVFAEPRLRERIRIYLSRQPVSEGCIRLRTGRSELASEIGADRSALSRELGRMQSEGLITIDGRKIIINDSSFLEE